MGKITIEDCRKAAEALGGKCLSEEYKNNTTKMDWMCAKKHLFKTIYKTVSKGHWCPECAGVKKLTQEFVENVIIKKGGRLLSPYISSGEKIKVQCLKDNHIWHTTWDNIKGEHWCPKCVNRAKIDISEVESFIKTKRGILIDGSNYREAKSKIKVKCLKDNYIWETTWDYLKQGNWCPDCAGKILLSYEEFSRILQMKNGVISEGPTSFKHDTVFKIKCLKDNYIWKTNYFRIIYQNQWCPKCAGCVLKTFEEVKILVESKNGELVSNKEDLQNNKSKLKIKCEKNHSWVISYANLVNHKRWCPVCAFSKTQKKLFDIIEEIFNTKCFFNYKGFDWLKDKRLLEIDIWVPELKLAIEYDGIHHFKPINYSNNLQKAKERLADRKRKDKLKTKLIKEHPEEIEYFIRFNYRNKVESKQNVLAKLQKYDIPISKKV